MHQEWRPVSGKRSGVHFTGHRGHIVPRAPKLTEAAVIRLCPHALRS
jgi:hypothetical protein